MTAEFNLIRFQDELISTMNRTWNDGRRAQPTFRAAIRKAKATLVKMGWAADRAAQIVSDAGDIWHLNREVKGPRQPWHIH